MALVFGAVVATEMSLDPGDSVAVAVERGVDVVSTVRAWASLPSTLLSVLTWIFIVILAFVSVRSAVVSFDGYRWFECGSVAEALEHGSQEAGHLLAFDGLEAGDALVLCSEHDWEGVFDQVGTGWREPHEHTAPVEWVWVTGDQSGLLEAMKPNRHPAPSEEKSLGEFGGSETAVGVGAVELGERIEIALMAQSICGCDGVEFRLKVARRAQYASHDCECGGVKVWSVLRPLLEDVVHMISHLPPPSTLDNI